MAQEAVLRQVIKSRKFWVTTAAIASASLILYDWYSDRYALPSKRYSRIECDYEISVKLLRKIRKEFVKEMALGLSEDDDLHQSEKKSSLKMLSSHVRSIPDGTEKGVFYTIDWGGTNYRILRVELSGTKGSLPKISEFKAAIPSKYQTSVSSEALFDYLAQSLKEKLVSDGVDPNSKQAVGLTFSFPMAQSALNHGRLIEWTKGFDLPDVVDKDIVKLMHKAFNKHQINAEIYAVCNDSVGTLLACAYEHTNVRVGLILGTGSNAGYIEPNAPIKHDDDDEKDNFGGGAIINIEWGNFHKLLPRMPTDFIMDEYTPNPGLQYSEKMISGHYLGELVRLLSIEVFREQITNYGENTCFNFRWQFESKNVSAVLGHYYDGNIQKILDILQSDKCGLIEFNLSDAEVFGKLCMLIVNRSADLAATLLLGTLERTGLYTCHREDDRNPFENDRFELTDKYKQDNNEFVTVGIDGSVYQYVPRYKERMVQTMVDVVGNQVAERIKLVHLSDGSGKGAALAVAASNAFK